jgi:hypothetical protein
VRLFTQVRGRRILRGSDAGSCINPPPRAARMASEGLHHCGQGSNILWWWMDMQNPGFIGVHRWLAMMASKP